MNRKEPNRAYHLNDGRTVIVVETPSVAWLAYIDTQDYSKVKNYRWTICSGRYLYARKRGEKGGVLIQQLILPSKFRIAYKDGDGFNNTRQNLYLRQNRAYHLFDGRTVITEKGPAWFCYISTEDYGKVKPYKWSLLGARRHYAQTWLGKEGSLTMHRLLLPTTAFVDHKDRNGLNNTRENLREATQSENMRNRAKFNRLGITSSKFIGVSFNKRASKFTAYVAVAGGQKYLERFDNEEEAARVRDEAVQSLYGPFATFNLNQELGA